MMTVEELTRILAKCPQKFEVCLNGHGSEIVNSVAVINNEKTIYRTVSDASEKIPLARKQLVVLSTRNEGDKNESS